MVIIGANMSYGTGISIKSLVAKNKNVSKILIFWTFSKTVKVTDSQMGTKRKFKGS
jgi:hypothetical protein